MDIIRIISNTRTVRNTIKRAINVTKRQIDPTTEVMLEIEVTVEIPQEQIIGVPTVDPQETEAVHPDPQAAGVDLPDHQDIDSNFCYNTNIVATHPGFRRFGTAKHHSEVIDKQYC